MKAPQRILVVRLSHLGDVVQTLPLFHALRNAHPKARIGWVVEPAFAGLVRGMPGLDEVIEFDRHGGWRAWPRVRSQLRAFRPDLTVDAQGNAKSAAIALVSGAARRVGPARGDWREPSARFLVNERAPRARGLHAHARVVALVEHLTGSSEMRRDPALTDTERAAGRESLATVTGGASPLVILQVGAADDVRTPTDECLISIGCESTLAGRPVLLTSAPREAKRVSAIAAAMVERVGDARAPTQRTEPESLRSFAAWLGAAAERSAVFVSADSGPLHLAAAMGLSCVCLSGPFDWRATGPWPSPTGSVSDVHRALTASPPPSCAPCAQRRCHRIGGRVCMESIDAKDVARAVYELSPSGASGAP